MTACEKHGTTSQNTQPRNGNKPDECQRPDCESKDKRVVAQCVYCHRYICRSCTYEDPLSWMTACHACTCLW